MTRRPLKSPDDPLIEAVGAKLDGALPNGRRATDEFVAELQALPEGLRAMAAVYELDVSMALDDLGWHFGNWHHEGLAEETARGLDALGASEMAGIFREALSLAKNYWQELGEEDWGKWYFQSPLDQALEPLNQRAWALLKARDRGLLSYWADYARNHPECLR